MSNKVENTKCPHCGEKTLDIDVRLKAKEIGEFSLSGQQMKVSASAKPVIFCTRDECDFEQWGWLEGEHAAFHPLS